MSEPKLLVGYGALYLDRGERMPNALEQINAIREKALEAEFVIADFGFDILFKQGQHGMAERFARQVEDAIHESFAGYPG